MWNFQEEMVRGFHSNRFSIAKMPRQVGKTTTTAGYMLWAVLFTDDYKIAILANKGDLARDILGRIKYSYEYLPLWMQQGIMEWNKGNIVLENGSEISAYATNASGVRGGTYNLVFLDEFAFVPQNIAAEFFTSTYPVISSGKTTKVIIVSTPHGLNQFYKMWTDAVEQRSLYVPFEVHWSMVPGRDATWREETIRNTSEEQFRQEFETEFIGSSATLIPGAKLKMLTFNNPVEKEEYLEEDLHQLLQPVANLLFQFFKQITLTLWLDLSLQRVNKWELLERLIKVLQMQFMMIKLHHLHLYQLDS
jgi:hypothetical protein